MSGHGRTGPNTGESVRVVRDGRNVTGPTRPQSFTRGPPIKYFVRDRNRVSLRTTVPSDVTADVHSEGPEGRLGESLLGGPSPGGPGWVYLRVPGFKTCSRVPTFETVNRRTSGECEFEDSPPTFGDGRLGCPQFYTYSDRALHDKVTFPVREGRRVLVRGS